MADVLKDPIGSNKWKAAGMVMILLAISGGVYLLVKGGTEDEKEESPGEEGMFTVEVLYPNFKVTNIPQANNEPSVAVNPTDPLNIVAASNDYGTPRGDAWCGFYATFDGGMTWERGLVPGYDGDPDSDIGDFEGGGDPVLTFAPNGDCYLAGIVFQRDPNWGNLIKPGSGIFVARSTDGGRTFPQVSLVSRPSISNYITFHDKEWIAVDPTTGNVHVTWTIFNAFGMVGSFIVHSMSTDQGRTWSWPPTILSEITELERQTQGSQVEVDSSGVIHVSWIDFGREDLRYTRSTDGGNSFSPAESIADVEPMPYNLPNAEYRTPTMCDMAVDTSGGKNDGAVYICWPDHSSGNADIMMIGSLKGDGSFLSPVKVNNDTGQGDQFFPAICVGSDGSVQLIFYDRRDDPDNDLISVYYAHSDNNGKNFTNLKWYDPDPGGFDGGNTRGPFIGDYLAIAAGPTRTYGVWCDAREGTEEEVRSDIWGGIVRYIDEERPEA